MIPMSTEGFQAMAAEVVIEMDDHNVDAMIERFGLPKEDVRRLVGVAVTDFLAHHNVIATPAVIKACAESFVLGMAIGSKAGEWQEKASNASTN